MKVEFSGLRAFHRNQGGAIAVIFAIVAVVTITAAGIAVDTARAVKMRTSLQEALDGAVLAAVVTGVTNDAEAEVVADQYFASNWYNKSGNIPVQFKFDVQTQSVGATATADVPTKLLRVVGLESLEIDVEAAAKTGGDTLELSLVLDTTSSMEGDKIATLKDVAEGLVDTLETHSESVSIGVVPFTEYVNIGLGMRGEPWLSVEDDTSWAEERCETKKVQVNCQEVSKTGYKDGLPYSYTETVCDEGEGEGEKVCTPGTAERVWSGCVGSRDYPLDVDDTSVSSSAPVPGIMNRMCGEEMLDLTSNMTAVKAKINSMSAWGDTYVPSGLLWGLRMLSPDEPLTTAKAYSEMDDGLKKAIVLLTDGANSHSPLYPSHDGRDTVLANELTAELCTNIKAKGILLFTVAFEVSDDTTLDMLETCATDSTYFYDAGDSSALEAAFDNMAIKLMEVHLYQ